MANDIDKQRIEVSTKILVGMLSNGSLDLNAGLILSDDPDQDAKLDDFMRCTWLAVRIADQLLNDCASLGDRST